MERVEAALVGHAVIGIDSSIFIYFVEDVEGRAHAAGTILRLIAGLSGVTSTLTLTEAATRPYQIGRSDLADEYRTLVTTFPQLMVAGIDVEIALRAARLRASHGLRTPDALQVAACLEHGATAFVTNDRRLRRVTELDVILIDDFVTDTHAP